MIKAKYEWKKIPNNNQKLVKQISDQCNISSILANYMVSHGIDNLREAQHFLKPQLQDIQVPNKLHDMEKGTKRIQDAISNGEKITIYGDYDADGITSTSLLYEALESRGANVNYYVPDRFKDGYGPNMDVYKKIINSGTKLIVTVDNGVSGKDEIAYAKEQGVDVVITDHHSLPDELPKAVAIIHPQYPGDEYPYGDLSGVGVAFKLAWSLIGEFPSELLDLVAIGEIADLVSLKGENHALLRFGLKQLNNDGRPGLEALMQKAGLNINQITDQDIGFKIAPRLNALGRIADANDGVKLLTTSDSDEATRLADQVDKCNQERQSLVKQITAEALQRAQSPDNEKRRTLLIIGHGWHQGVLGIVASHIVEKTGKPTIVASNNTGELELKGSGRSVRGYNLFEALDHHRNLMTSFGGHDMACGMSFMITQTPALARALEQAADEQKFIQDINPELEVCGTLSSDDLNLDFYKAIQKLGPFGTDNDEPLFEIDQPAIANTKTIGTNNNHLKFDIKTQNGLINVIGFNDGALRDQMNDQVQLVVSLSMNYWQGKSNLQLMLKDAKNDAVSVVDERSSKMSPQLFSQQATYVVFNDRLRNNIAGHANGDVISGLNDDVDNFVNDELIFVDCPQTLEQVITVIKKYPELKKIKLWLFNNQKIHNGGFPSRKQFVTLYQTISRSRPINVNNQLQALANYLKLTQDQLTFMIKVFLELRFVTINNGVLKMANNQHHINLSSSKLYRQYQQRLDVENILIKSSTRQLVQWISKLTN